MALPMMEPVKKLNSEMAQVSAQTIGSQVLAQTQPVQQ